MLKNRYQLIMTEAKWLNFAGYLNICIHELDHPECPFKCYRNMDQYQRLELLLSIHEDKANQIMSCCQNQRTDCSRPIIHKQEPEPRMSLIL